MKVSIIIPVYNVEKYVAECLQSVLSQDYADKEIIIVDDCSTDNSMDVVRSVIAEKEPQCGIRIIEHECNRGAGAARNTGIRAATGDWLFFMDSDDYLMRDDAVSQMVNLAVRYPKAEMVYCGMQSDHSVWNDWSDWRAWGNCEYIEKKSEIKTKMLRNRLPQTRNNIIRREWLLNNGLFYKEGIFGEDAYWQWFAAKRVSAVAMLKTDLYYYRLNAESIMRSKNRNLSKWKTSYSIIIRDAVKSLDFCSLGAQLVFLKEVLGDCYWLDREACPSFFKRRFGQLLLLLSIVYGKKGK